MALSNEDKFRVVYSLGYAGKVLVVGSREYNSIINDRLADLDAFTQDAVEELLTKIDTSKTKLNTSSDDFKVKQVGDIHFNIKTGSSLINKEYKRLLKELSALLDIPLMVKTGTNFSVVL